MLSWQKCCSDKADQKSHLGRQAGRQATREWKRNGLAYACSVSHSKLTDQTPSSTFQVEEVRRGPGETGSVTAEKLPPWGRRHGDWEVLSLTSFSFLSVKCFPHFPSLSSLLACSSILPSTWGANQVLLLFLSFPNGFHLIPGWVSLEPLIHRLVGLSSSAMDLRTHGEPTWEAGGESLCHANYGHKQTL